VWPDLRAELERHHLDCVGWALGCCGWDRSEAEDVLQSSYLKVLDGRAVYRARSCFRTWIFGVIRRTAGEHRRRRLLRRFVSGALLRVGEAADPSPGAADELECAEATAHLRAALAALPRRQRELLHLVFYQDMTIQDAAEVLGIAIGTARTHYERGKARLRELLTVEDGL
jgi:RNA polymerase sigma-70 factor (ECF subfamily)